MRGSGAVRDAESGSSDTNIDIERQDEITAAVGVAEAAGAAAAPSPPLPTPPLPPHHPHHPHHRIWRTGSLEQLRWNAGNREGGRDDEGSVHSSRTSSRAGSKHGGSQYYGDGRSAHGGSQHGGGRTSAYGERSAHGGSQNGGGHGERSVHGASRLGGSRHGGASFSDGFRHGGSQHNGSGSNGSPRPPGYDLPGQGGPLQDNAGLSMASMKAQRPHHHHEDEESGDRVAGAAAKLAKHSKRAGRPFWKLLRKWRGGLDTAHPRPAHWWGLIIMPVGAFLGIFWISGINRYTLPELDMRILNPTFGASAVLLFGVPESKLSQPRNFLGGQLVSVITGCVVRVIFPDHLNYVAAPVAVCASLLLMMLTRTVHPPGGATALMVGSQVPHGRWDSWIYVPAIMIGSLGMQIIALVMNVVAPGRRYPTFWWGSDNFFGGL